jgi:multiple sugar transport system permease protein
MTRRWVGWLYAGPALLVIAVFFVVPVLAALVLSVTPLIPVVLTQA